MRIYSWILMPTACVHPTLGKGVRCEFNRVGENSVQFCTNPCPPFMTLLAKQGCSISTEGFMSLCLERGVMVYGVMVSLGARPTQFQPSSRPLVKIRYCGEPP